MRRKGKIGITGISLSNECQSTSCLFMLLVELRARKYIRMYTERASKMAFRSSQHHILCSFMRNCDGSFDRRLLLGKSYSGCLSPYAQARGGTFEIFRIRENFSGSISS